MNALNTKLLRDLWRLRGQAFAIGLVIGAAMATFVMAMGVHHSLTQTRDAYYDRYQYGDVFVSMTRAPLSVAGRVEAIKGVAVAEGRIEQFATLELPGRIEPIRAIINSVGPSGETRLNNLVLLRGRGPVVDNAAEVVIDKAFADANGIDLGARIDAVIYGSRSRLEVVGIGLAPDYIWSIAPGELVPDASRFGIFWMGEKALEAASGHTGAINSLSLRLQHGAREPEVIRHIDTVLAQYGGTGAVGRQDHVSNAFLTSELDQLQAMTKIIPPIFLLVSTFLVYVVLGRTIRTEREEIGLMKAFGYGNGAIGWHYLKFAIAVALLGITMGAAVGWWMGLSMTEQYAEYYRFPFLFYQVSADVFATGATLALGSAAIGAIGGVRAAVSLTPAVAMSPPPPPVYRAGLFERLGAWAKLSSVGNMIVRHIARWPGRSAVTVSGVALSLGLLFATIQFIDGSRAMLDNYFFRAQRQDLSVAFIEPQNEKILTELASLPGVMRVEATRAVPVLLRNGPRSERVAIESAGEFDRLTARVDANGFEVAVPASGLMLSRSLAAKLDLSPGNRTQVTLLGGRQTETTLTVASIIDELIGTRAYARPEALTQLTRDGTPVGSANLLIDPLYRDELIVELGNMPQVLGLTERDAAMRLFEEIIEENIMSMMGFYISFAAAIAVGVVYNGARILFSERAHELATMRVLGYHRSEVGLVLLGELALLVVIAVPVGCLTGYWLAQLMVTMFSSDLFRLPFAPNRSSYGLASLVILAAASATALIVARRVARLDMVRVLKARD
ncbi:FtsX-like permease family protein [Pontixanthobacter gangjinensis]|uniref:FtsX-like permease family protein n=1 Tax=Pontixanthobacter gangjinensis TaxID=1028742 RepID=A0A6I4SQ34_9SPHN|nr:FtsX-like permease family protein [Pontixanthobacter gangjinensis]MXO57270.1 FtsX-like permease family protein [Pontixanthobacter gangjinensis]